MVAWHLKGAAGTIDEWLAMDSFKRQVVVMETRRRVKVYNSQFDEI